MNPKRVKSGLPKCPGHWINKKMGLKNEDLYDKDGKWYKCGKYKV